MKIQWKIWCSLVAVLASLAALAGCAARAPLVDDLDPPEPTPIVDNDQTSSASTGETLRLSAPASMVATIHEMLGDTGTLTLAGEPRKIARDDVTINLPSSTSATYSLAADGGTITFTKPVPTVTAKLFAGIKVSPSLIKIVLNADDTATVHVRSMLGTRLRTFPLGWETDSESTAIANELPVVFAYSTAGCAPCIAAKRELAEAKDLPFSVHWMDDRPACVTGSFPAFWWHRSEDTPRENDSQNTRVRNGWTNTKTLIETWKANREGVKRAQSRPFARPADHDYIGSRSVAQWSINGDFTPSRSVLLSHLSHDGIHRGRHDRKWLESLTTQQMQKLHDRDHQGY